MTLEKRLENAVDSKLDQIGLDDEEKETRRPTAKAARERTGGFFVLYELN
ncbi:MAG: hypothetical protein ACLUE1_07000 [Adlercreutzia equolifaciens]